MGIDGIGKPGPGAIPAPLATAHVPGVSGAAAPFPALSPEAPAEVEATPLTRLERGEITLDQYLDLRVESATAHLHLASGDLAFIRDTLRAELSRDPALLELVRRATGFSPVDSKP